MSPHVHPELQKDRVISKPVPPVHNRLLIIESAENNGESIYVHIPTVYEAQH